MYFSIGGDSVGVIMRLKGWALVSMGDCGCVYGWGSLFVWIGGKWIN